MLGIGSKPQLGPTGEPWYSLYSSLQYGRMEWCCLFGFPSHDHHGKSLWDAKITSDQWHNQKNLEATDHSWGKLMEQKGYQTYMTGKWHVPIDPKKIFQTVRNIRPGMPRDFFKKEGRKGYDRPKQGQVDTWNAADSLNGGFWEGGKHWSEVIKDDALDFLKQANDKEAPFFMYFECAPRSTTISSIFFDRIFGKNNYPKTGFRNTLQRCQGPKTLRDEALAHFPEPICHQNPHQEYYAIISR